MLEEVGEVSEVLSWFGEDIGMGVVLRRAALRRHVLWRNAIATSFSVEVTFLSSSGIDIRLSEVIRSAWVQDCGLRASKLGARARDDGLSLVLGTLLSAEGEPHFGW